MQGKRIRALDSRGRPVPGIYVRDGRYIAGFNCPQSGKWRTQKLAAETLTEARRERDAILSGLRDGTVRAKSGATVRDLFIDWQDARPISDRTRAAEAHTFGKHVSKLADRRAQDVTASDVGKLLRDMREKGYSEWTRVHVYRVVKGSFAHGLLRGVLTRSPIEGLSPSEIPKQRNAKAVEVLDPEAIAYLVESASSSRWKCALGLAAFAGLRLGEIRALRWSDVNLDAGTIAISRSMTPGGDTKAPKSLAGVRRVPILPALRQTLVTWRLRSPHSRPDDLVVATATGGPVQERNVARALDSAKKATGCLDTEGRLSMHSLRHSCLSALATGGLAAATLAEVAGHEDPGFTYRVYVQNVRNEEQVVADVLDRAAGAGFGG